MEKEFIPYEQALALKELGFDEPCLGYWSDWGTQEPFLLTCELGTEKESCSIRRKNLLCSAPTFSQAFRWFREKHDLFIAIVHYINGYSINDLRRFETFEEAELACLTKLIEIVKNK